MPYKDPADRVAYMAKYFKDNREKFRQYGKKWYDKDPKHANELREARKQVVRNAVIAAYGNKCACCSETIKEFLSVDHVNGGGGKHRKEIGGTEAFYYWLRRHGFPQDEFRLLCMNCNFSFGMYGYCPHNNLPAMTSHHIGSPPRISST